MGGRATDQAGVAGTRRLSLTAPAKVNLALSVGAPDADTGYHPIASWMVALDFGDDVVIERLTPERTNPEDAGAVREADRFAVTIAPDTPVVQPVDWPIERDLAWRALAAVERHVGGRLAVRVRVIKRVPAGAGLGGGSADAAAVLVGLNELFELGLSDADLTGLARSLGSDVVFAVAALRGAASAFVGGFGERVEPTSLPAPLHLVLVFPPASCPTAAVYRAFDEAAAPDAVADELRVRALMDAPLDREALFNDLAGPAMRAAPEVREAFERVRRVTDAPVHVTGSGSTLFVPVNTAGAAEGLAAVVRRATGLPALATRTRAPDA